MCMVAAEIVVVSVAAMLQYCVCNGNYIIKIKVLQVSLCDALLGFCDFACNVLCVRDVWCRQPPIVFLMLSHAQIPSSQPNQLAGPAEIRTKR